MSTHNTSTNLSGPSDQFPGVSGPSDQDLSIATPSDLDHADIAAPSDQDLSVSGASGDAQLVEIPAEYET